MDNLRESKPVNLSEFKLEKHVEQAFRLASSLAGKEKKPINSGDALRAVLLLGMTSQSEAFRIFSSWLSPNEQSVGTISPNQSLIAVPLGLSLAKSWDIAKEFFSEKEVWGRDYITLALLAADDPFLVDLMEASGTSLADIQDKWFEFVTSDERRRSSEEWTRWWRKAGVPLPNERTRHATQPKPHDASGNTYLLTWDPERFAFKKFSEEARKIKERGSTATDWNVGHSEIRPGDKVYLMRHCPDKAGLVGYGLVISEAHEGRHWDKNKPDEWRSFYASIQWKSLNEFPVVPLDRLLNETGEKQLWTQEGSGLPIPPDLAVKLDLLWQQCQDRPGRPQQPLAFVQSDAIFAIGSRDFQPSQFDKLNVTQQAHDFSTLLISRDVNPPFAIGLLGDWGVGKTFFMRLMQEKVRTLAGKEVSQGQSEQYSAYVSRVAQIEFNAWHYVDSDLWASLASHIFDSLSEELNGEEDSVQATRLRLRQSIKSSQEGKAVANAAIDSAKEAQKSAIEQLSKKQGERLDNEKLRLGIVWQALIEDPKDNPLASLKQKAEDTSRRLGLTEAIDSAEEAKRVYGQLRELSQRGLGLIAVVSAFTGKSAILSILLLAGLLAFVFVCPWFLELITPSSTAWESARQLLAPLIQMVAVLGGVSTWLSTHLEPVSSAMHYLERIIEKVNKPRSEPVNDDEKRLLEEIAKEGAEISAEESKIQGAEEQIALAQAEIQRIDAGGLVYDFLGERVRDSRYRDRLGLISVIRQDFEQIGKLLRDWQTQGNQQSLQGNPNPIERIILYIDDLDRCPPKRVVEVLQAVHLLLAFDLFNVVVAVDGRWLERALNETYNPVQDGYMPQPLHRFSAHNYLEKIFQIPFQLPQMTAEGYSALIESLANVKDLLPEKPGTNANPEGTTDRKEGPEGNTKVARAAVDRQKEKERHKVEKNPDSEKNELERRNEEEEKRRIEAMRLLDYEQKFISQLFPFIPSPRLAKRFINTYRLLRVLAKTNGFFDALVDSENGEYRAVLVLLAINIGYIEVAPEIILGLRSEQMTVITTGGGFLNWLMQLSEKYELELSGLNQERLARKEKPAPNDRETRVGEFVRELSKIMGHIKEIKNKVLNNNIPCFDDNLATYCKWADAVGRYSFRSPPNS